MKTNVLYNLNEFNDWFVKNLGLYEMIAIHRNEPSPIKYPATVHSEIVDNGIDNPFSFYVMYYSFSYDR